MGTPNTVRDSSFLTKLLQDILSRVGSDNLSVLFEENNGAKTKGWIDMTRSVPHIRSLIIALTSEGIIARVRNSDFDYN